MIAGTLLLSITALAIFGLPLTRDFLSNCSYYTSKLASHRLDELATFAAMQTDDAEFHRLSDGLRGVMRRLWEMSVLMRLLQIHVLANVVATGAAWEAFRMALLQIFFSFIAIPEALLCRIWRDLPHLSALAAFRYHYNLSVEVTNLLQREGTPDCIYNDGHLL